MSGKNPCSSALCVKKLSLSFFDPFYSAFEILEFQNLYYYVTVLGF